MQNEDSVRVRSRIQAPQLGGRLYRETLFPQHASIWFRRNTYQQWGGSAGSRLLKRVADIVVSLLLLIVAFPVMLLICVAISFETPGFPLYLQWRSGRHGKPFRIYKLRTMISNADRLGPQLTQDADPRVTRSGSLLRRWSLDEVPQLVNVLVGQMSLVGPRPEVLSIVSTYTESQRNVLLARPGITGWAQVNGRDDLSIREKLDFELDYIQGRTARMDLNIVRRTVSVVLSGRGTKR